MSRANDTLLPWCFTPWSFYLVIFPGFVAPPFYAAHSVGPVQILMICWGILSVGLYLFWPTLLIEHLSMPATERSKHETMSSRITALVLGVSLLLALLLGLFGVNTSAANELADLIIIPIFAAFSVQLWRAAKLLVAAERPHPDLPQTSRLHTGFAIIFLPVTIVGFHNRLKRLSHANAV